MINDIEIEFLSRFPGGFDNYEIIEEDRKFNDINCINIIQNELSQKNYKVLLKNNDIQELDRLTLKFISKTWITSRFDKIGYRNFLKYCDAKDIFYSLLYNAMYVNEFSFNDLANFSKTYDMSYDKCKCCCWPTLSAFMCYSREDYYPIKPTSVKKLANYLDFNLEYKPLPNINTYQIYNNQLNGLLKISKLCNTKKQIDIMLFLVIVKGVL